MRASHVFGKLAELEFLDLARGGFGNLREYDVPGNLVAGQVLLAVGNKGLASRFRSRFQFHERAGRFAPFFVRFGNDGAVGNGWMLIEDIFDLYR